MAETSKHFKNQLYSNLKKQYTSGSKLFEDKEFPITTLSEQHLGGTVKWMRPTAICTNPKLVDGRLNSSNISQGSLGNCWFVASCCCLAKEKDLWNKVVPHYDEQEYKDDPQKHGGLFCFRFWRFGHWVEVVIDDRLPTINGKLVFAHSKKKNEFWCALVEKAYANHGLNCYFGQGKSGKIELMVRESLGSPIRKFSMNPVMYGSYKALQGGNLVDALVDFTGGFAEQFNVDEEGAKVDAAKREKLFAHLKDEKKHHSLMCCAISDKKLKCKSGETELSNGLVMGHAYCITDARTINIKRTGLFAFFKNQEHLDMIRLRNPWGKKEWNGRFSDSSQEWLKISSKDKEKCDLNLEDDGEFWMTFEDFCKNFTDVSLCYLVNTSWFSFGHNWSEAQFTGQWSDGSNGGCSNNKNTFYQNPQYCFDVKYPKEKLLLMLQQKDTRGENSNVKMISIGIHILKVELNRKYRIGLHSPQVTTETSKFVDTRNVFYTCDSTLDPGRYLLIPTTFERNKNTDYFLRVFSKNSVNLRQLKLNGPNQPSFSCLQNQYRLATRVEVREGNGIKLSNSDDHCSPYFILSCENAKVRGSTKNNTRKPDWHESAVFYRRKTNSKLKIEVFDSQKLKNVRIGSAVVDIPKADNNIKAIRLKLTPASSKDKNENVGEVIIEIFTTKDILDI